MTHWFYDYLKKDYIFLKAAQNKVPVIQFHMLHKMVTSL